MPTDNKSITSKLAVRRRLLDMYGVRRVMDCCQGNGVLWAQLRKEYQLESYWGMDLKAAPGRMAIDSSRVLSQPGWREDVIDIDTYGSPWRHWLAMLPNVTQDTTVFLTIGRAKMGLKTASQDELDCMGIGGMRLPYTVRNNLHHLSWRYCLDAAVQMGLRFAYLCRAESEHAKYLGLRLLMQAA